MTDATQPSSPIDPILETANPRSINELMTADPLSYSTQDLDRIIADMRARRGEFMLEEAAKAAKPPREKKSKVVLSPTEAKQSLDELLAGL